MPLLYVHNDDIVNNTGIVLSNPTGDIGTYELKNDPDITETWYISGAPFTGNIVTIGPSGKDYTSVKGAIDSAVVDTLFLIDAGTYIDTSVIEFKNDINYYIRGLGNIATDTIINTTGDSYNRIFVPLKGRIILENIQVGYNQWPIAYPHENLGYTTMSESMIINKCIIYHNNGIGFGWSGTLKTMILNVNYSLSKTSKGDSNWAHFTYVDLSKISLNKTSYNESWKVLYSSGTLFLDDKAIDGTTGYGYEYGDYIITAGEPIISNHNISWGGGTTTEITEDGVYTLSDGSNTIDATIDYSELSTETTIDNVRVVLTVSGSIILQSLPNVQLVKVGTTQQYLLSIVSSGGIIEDYITSDVTWSSSNEEIATVSSSGLVTAISLGTVTITATYGEFSLSIGIRTTTDTRTRPLEPDRLSPHPYTYTATLGVSSRTGVK